MKNFISSDFYVQNFENHNSAVLKTDNQDFPESQGNNTYQNNTDPIYTDRLPFCSGDDKPAEAVRSVFLKINCEHIRMVMDNLKKNSTEVKNIRQYILASIYNSSLTISSYYQAMVNYDLNRT